MEVEALKPFKFSLDGVTAEDAAVGAVVNVRDCDVLGLVAAGYVKAISLEHGEPVPVLVEEMADAPAVEAETVKEAGKKKPGRRNEPTAD